ncbi:unnamed protein product [Brachionus calyciflorus]|uniref:Uncharacterized protein n=1 Tax=Brachionus calyciflorus TaxID=104777 RepID=A0A814DM17_9BILA|nr:unnamed protein product [Brachionus calyciflorus]
MNGKIYQDKIKYLNRDSILVSLNLNTDGAPLVKSQAFSLWPIFATVAELKSSLRDKFENMIILGLWLSVKKPVMDFYLNKCLEKLQNFIDKNLEINGSIIHLRVQSFIADLPARAQFLKINQYNGKFACLNCHDPGIYDHTYHKMTYPPMNQVKLRSSDDYNLYSKLADLSGDDVFGIKGRTALGDLIEIPRQVPYDYMHLVCQGHSKWILKQLFDSPDTEYDLTKSIEQIDVFLNQIKYPTSFPRKPRKIKKYSKWKSSQLKIFILFLAVPIFLEFLSVEYFYLLSAYALVIRTLYEPCNDEEIDTANILIKEYYEALKNFFGSYAYDFTIHAHTHLTEQVKEHGPLFETSQFVFEVGYI